MPPKRPISCPPAPATNPKPKKLKRQGTLYATTSKDKDNAQFHSIKHAISPRIHSHASFADDASHEDADVEDNMASMAADSQSSASTPRQQGLISPDAAVSPCPSNRSLMNHDVPLNDSPVADPVLGNRRGGISLAALASDALDVTDGMVTVWYPVVAQVASPHDGLLDSFWAMQNSVARFSTTLFEALRVEEMAAEMLSDLEAPAVSESM